MGHSGLQSVPVDDASLGDWSSDRESMSLDGTACISSQPARGFPDISERPRPRVYARDYPIDIFPGHFLNFRLRQTTLIHCALLVGSRFQTTCSHGIFGTRRDDSSIETEWQT